LKKKIKLKKEEFIELFPYGLCFSIDDTRPVFILKSLEEKEVLPVWLSPLDASLTVAASENSQNQENVHKIALQTLKAFDLKIKECRFMRLQGNQQFVNILVQSKNGSQILEFRADQTMSFCLSAGVRFFAKKSLMQASRELDQEYTLQFSNKEKLPGKNQTYLM